MASHRCYDANVEHSYLVFEDLSASGFATEPRHDGLGITHYRLLLSKLAKWHATGATLLRTDPSFADNFADEPGATTNVMGQLVLQHCSTALADAAQLMPSVVCQRIGAKIEALLPTIGERMWQAMRRHSDGFNVITHGDLWSNNVMYQHTEDSTPTDALLVDFQMGVHCSPMVDLMYALFTSSHRTLTKVDWDALIEHYHRQLVDTLTKLSYPAADIPTLAALLQDWRRIGAGAALQYPFVAAVRMCTYESGASLAHLSGRTQEDREYRRDVLLKGVAHPESVVFLLGYADECGFYD